MACRCIPTAIYAISFAALAPQVLASVASGAARPSFRGASGAANQTECLAGEKELPTAEDFIRQVSLGLQDSECCGTVEHYTVSSSVYGLIHGPLSTTDGYLYTSDKAVAWMTDHKGLEVWVNKREMCCDAGSMSTCMCRVADEVEIAKVDGQYDLVAINNPTVVVPKWTGADFHEIFVKSYAWVFKDAKLDPQWESIDDLQQRCRPAAETWQVLMSFGAGMQAYSAIMANATYGVAEGGQMESLKCSSIVNASDGSGGCECLGRRDATPYCDAVSDTVLFCGAGGLASCDPSRFLCPADGLPVGSVRAYLHKFFDANPFFHGTGFADEHGQTAEYIMPNVLVEAGMPKTTHEELFAACT